LCGAEFKIVISSAGNKKQGTTALATERRVVLSSDMTVMSSYGNSLFYGFLSTVPNKRIGVFSPGAITRFVLHKVPTDAEGRAMMAPQGLRRLESSLISSGVVTANEVAVTPPDNIGRMITGETKAVGIAAIDPFGRGPSSTTFGGKYGAVHEEPINALQFRRLMASEPLRLARRAGAKVIVGGPGAWQLGEAEMAEHGIDVVIDGEADLVFPSVVKSAMEGTLRTPAIIKPDQGMIPEAWQIPLLRGGTIGGLVEVARGCGRGCRFCMPTLRRVRHRSVEDISADVRTNVAFGVRCACLHAEDVLRYGTLGIVPDHDRVVALFEAVRRIPGVEDISVSHCALASIASSPQTVGRVAEVLGLERHRWMGFQTGIETGSPRLIQNLMNMKPAPFKAEEWGHVVESAFAICNDNNWVPAATIMVNLPGETEDDVLRSVELVDSIHDYRSLIVPLLFAPFSKDDTKPMRFIEDAKRCHFELYRSIWRHDMRWIRDVADDYKKTSGLTTRLAIGAIVWGLRSYGDAKVRAYFDRKIEELRQEWREEERGEAEEEGGQTVAASYPAA
jgi:radical SAM superfamily enzyme YgiQ (UPF0313 family)